MNLETSCSETIGNSVPSAAVFSGGTVTENLRRKSRVHAVTGAPASTKKTGLGAAQGVATFSVSHVGLLFVESGAICINPMYHLDIK